MILADNKNRDIGIEYNINKIGNIILYLASCIKYLYLTKLIKLLYLIDEISIKESGVPVTWLDYKVWEKGPVPKSIYIDLKHDDAKLFSNLIESVDDGLGQRILAIKEADVSDFSKYELNTLKQIIKDFGEMSGEQLVDYLHKSGSLWDKIVNEKNLKTHFETSPTSNHSIDFKELLDDPYRKMAYLAAEEAMYF